MIVVVEGANGAGKSALVRSLVGRLESPCFGFQTYRAFRRSDEEHFDGERWKLIRRLVPVNTYLEDMFAADVFGALSLPVVLDRSLPSGIAYGVAEGAISASKALDLLDLWLELLRGQDLALIQLVASSHVRRERTAGRRFDGALDDSVHSWIIMACAYLAKSLPVASIDTTSLSEEEVLQRASKFVRGVYCGNKAIPVD